MNGASGYNENNFFIAQSNISEALQTAVVDANRVRLIKLIAQRKKIVQEILVHNPDFPVVNDSLESTIFTDLQNFKRYQREENVAIYKNKLRQNIVRKYDTIPIDLIIRSRDIYFIENGVVYESMLSDVSCYHSFLMQSAKMPAEDLIHETHRAMFLSKQDGQENYRLIFPEILAAFETERLPDLFNTELLSKCAPGSIRIRGSRSTSTLDVMKLFSFIAEEKENGETINEYCKQSSTRPLNYINL